MVELNQGRQIPSPQAGIESYEDGARVLQVDGLVLREIDGNGTYSTLAFDDSLLDLFAAVCPKAYGRRLRPNIHRTLVINRIRTGGGRLCGLTVAIDGTNPRSQLVLPWPFGGVDIYRLGATAERISGLAAIEQTVSRIMRTICREVLLERLPG